MSRRWARGGRDSGSVLRLPVAHPPAAAPQPCGGARGRADTALPALGRSRRPVLFCWGFCLVFKNAREPKNAWMGAILETSPRYRSTPEKTQRRGGVESRRSSKRVFEGGPVGKEALFSQTSTPSMRGQILFLENLERGIYSCMLEVQLQRANNKCVCFVKRLMAEPSVCYGWSLVMNRRKWSQAHL